MRVCGKNLEAVIFDADGVLLDSMAIWQDLGARYLRKNGLEPENGLGEILFSMSMEQGAEYLEAHYNLKKTAPEILDGISKLLEDFYFYEVRLKPGAAGLVKMLHEKGIPLCVATSSPREHVERALMRNGLSAYISRLFTTAETGTSKHLPDIYYAAARYMNADVGHTLVFEDSLYALRTAANAGFITAGVYDEKGEKDQKGVERSCDIYLKGLANFRLDRH